MMATIRYDVSTAAGRAIQHLIDRTLTDELGLGLEIRWSGGGDRTLVIHPSMPRDEHAGPTGALLMLIESLAGTGAVNLHQLYTLTSPEQREHIALAMFMAAGYDVGAPSDGRRAAS